jgi:hypothetical protein
MTINHETPANESTEMHELVLRPPAVLMDLPVAYRWEVTRRHPYYLRFWELAHRRHTQPSVEPPQQALEQVAVLILLGIGVSGDPPSPGSSLESLGARGPSQAWESGAVAPVTFRGLIGMLLSDLPPDLLVQLGRLLQECGAAAQDPDGKYASLMQLYGLQRPDLDAFPRRPVVGINVDAPQRIITQAVEQFVRQWKEQQGIPERRRRDDKLADYLAVWDRREGWRGDRYDSSQERTLPDIAREAKIPLSTTANHYRAAFRLIVGHEYSPALWVRLFGVLKVSEWLSPGELPHRTLRRPWHERQPRAMPESALRAPGTASGVTGVLNLVGGIDAEKDIVDLIQDIQTLAGKGLSNAEIAAALEFTSPQAEKLVEYVRQRPDLP